MTEDRIRHDVLVRITDTPQLARAVPLLQPDVLHALITHCGLQDSGELLALATPAQLSAVLDLDLWKANRAGADEQFDAARFCEWLEVLVDAGPAIAADRLAAMDAALIVAGLSPSLAVFDSAVFSPAIEPSGADVTTNAGLERGVHAEIGGYLVVCRRPDAWEAIVEVLLALDARHPDAFHRVMRGCRKLTNSGFELDGLDNLLSNSAQAHFDLSLSREQRRDRLGFLSPQQARAFLDSARESPLAGEPPQVHPVFAAYRRSVADEPAADAASAVVSVIEILRGAGVLTDARRPLLPSGSDEPAGVNAALHRYLQLSAETDSASIAREQELAFLANALVAGCSVQGRAFTRREAMDAVAATCNLGLEYWPRHWPASSRHDLVAVFQAGLTILHRDVSMAAAEHLIHALDQLRSSDRDLQLELHVLRRGLHKARQARTPWRVRDRLDVLATLDLPTWAALTALFDECPVMLANVSAAGGRRPYTVNPAEFQFIAGEGHVAAVRAFLGSLAERLTQ
jgi:hypothetical protein